MRALFSAYDWADNISGPATWLGELLPALCQRGIDCHVDMLVWDEPGPLTACLEAQGVSVSCTRMLPFTEDNVGSLLARLSARNFDVFVPNNCVPSLFAASAVRAAGIQTVGVLHSDDAFYHGMLDVFAKPGGEFALSAVVAVSQSLMTDASGCTDKQTRAVWIPYGVKMPDSVGRCRRSPEDPFIVMYAGRFSQHQKRILEVAAAMREIVHQIAGTRCLMAGDGPEMQSVREILEPLITAGRVKLTGRLSPASTRQTMTTADALLLLSDFEGLPICLLEGMAHGLVPIVCHMKSGIDELVVHGETGFVVSDRCESVLDAVRLLKDNELLRSRLSAAAVSTVRDNFSEDRCVSRWHELLLSLCENKPRIVSPVCFRASPALPAVHEGLASEDHRRPPGCADVKIPQWGRLTRLRAIGRRILPKFRKD